MWEVRTKTVCDGWVNTWSDWYDYEVLPCVFESEEDAEAAIDEFFEDLASAGMADDYAQEDYAVYEIEQEGPLQEGLDAGTIDDMKARDKQVGGTHYQGKIQPWDIIDEYGLDFYEGCALKYILRVKISRREDIEKAIHCLEKKLETL